MATHSFGSGSPTPSNSQSDLPGWNHSCQSYSTAALRAGLIAIALLVVLAVLVLS